MENEGIAALIVVGGLLGWKGLVFILLRRPTISKMLFSGLTACWWGLMNFLGLIVLDPGSRSFLFWGIIRFVLVVLAVYPMMYLLYDAQIRLVNRKR